MQSGYWNNRAEEKTGDKYIYTSFKRHFDYKHQRGKLSLCKYVQLIPSISEYDLFRTLCLLKSTHYNPDSYQMETNYRRLCTRDTHTHTQGATHTRTMLNNSSWSTHDWQIIQRQRKAFLPPSNWAVSQIGRGQRRNMEAENSLSSPRALHGAHWEHSVSRTERPHSPAQSVVMWDEASGPVAPRVETLKVDVISVQTRLRTL